MIGPRAAVRDLSTAALRLEWQRYEVLRNESAWHAFVFQMLEDERRRRRDQLRDLEAAWDMS